MIDRIAHGISSADLAFFQVARNVTRMIRDMHSGDMHIPQTPWKRIRGADRTATVATCRRTYGDRVMQSTIDQHVLQVFVVWCRARKRV